MSPADAPTPLELTSDARYYAALAVRELDLRDPRRAALYLDIALDKLKQACDGSP